MNIDTESVLERLELTFGETPEVFLKMLPSNEFLAASDYMRRSLANVSLSHIHKQLLIYYFSFKNGSQYCTEIHHEILTMHGYDCSLAIEEKEFFDIADEDMKVLLSFAKEVSDHCGKVSNETKEKFLAHGFTEQSMLEVLLISTFAFSVNQTSRLLDL